MTIADRDAILFHVAGTEASVVAAQIGDYKLAGGIGMAVLQLTAEEADELHSILEGYFSELRMEIERTESGAFRSRLQTRERLVKKLLDELKQ